jgi:O-antigen/teichoic acid export membrane protein
MANRALYSRFWGNENSFSKKVLRDALLLVPGRLAHLLGGFAVTIILGKFLSPERLGVFTLFWIGQMYIALFASGWLQNAVIRFLPEEREYIRTYSRLSIMVAAAVGILGFIAISFLKESTLGHLCSESYFIWATIICSLSCFFLVNQSIFRGSFKLVLFSVNNFVLSSCQVIFLVFLIPKAVDRANMALIALAMSYVPAVVLQSISLWNLNKQVVVNRERHEGFRSLSKQSLIYGVPLSISLLLISFLQTGDRYILVKLLSLKELGIYSFWMRIGLNVSRAIYGLIFTILNPRFFELCATDYEKAKRYVRRLLDLYVLIIPAVLAVVGSSLILFLHLIRISPMYNTNSHLVFYAMGMAFLLGLTQLCGKNLEFNVNTKPFVYASSAGITGMVLGCYLLTPLFKMEGAAIGTLSGFCIYFLIIAIWSLTCPNILHLLISVTASALMIILFEFIKGKWGILSVSFMGLLFLMGYSLLGVRIYRISKASETKVKTWS